MTKAATTIQIFKHDLDLKKDFIYEAQIASIEEMVSLSYQFGGKAKYKKATDKNWYTFRLITKRLFKGIDGNYVKVKSLDVNPINDNEDNEPELQRKTEQKYSLEQIESMIDAELEDRLFNLYIMNYLNCSYPINGY